MGSVFQSQSLAITSALSAETAAIDDRLGQHLFLLIKHGGNQVGARSFMHQPRPRLCYGRPENGP
jgi:hypothetical protein